MQVRFAPKPPRGPTVVVVAAGAGGHLLPAARRLDRVLQGALAKAAAAMRKNLEAPQVATLAAPRGFAGRQVLLAMPGRTGVRDGAAAEMLGWRLVRELETLHEAAAILLLDKELSPRLGMAKLAAGVAFGARRAAYRFDRYRTKPRPDDRGKVSALTVVLPEARAAEKLWRRLEPVAEGIELARDLENEPGNAIHPAAFVRRAKRALAPLGVEVGVIEEARLRRLGMNALLAVGQGSANRPRLLTLRWRGKPGRPIAFVGKGVTFDSGGISIKKAKGMELMKADMSGAAAVVGLFRTLAARKAPVHAVGLAALVENMPSGGAYRPGDVVRSFSGKTVEVVDTDAEGRMILIDALAYAVRQFRPRAIVDLATLTYSVVAALGEIYAGLFSNDDALADRLLAASKRAGEKLWRLPLDEEYLANLKSPIADLRQCAPDEHFADAAHAAVFLGEFVGGTPWAHLDIAGKMAAKDPVTEADAGAPGYGIRLLDLAVDELIAAR
jgi:leucyl aminopeptidase